MIVYFHSTSKHFVSCFTLDINKGKYLKPVKIKQMYPCNHTDQSGQKHWQMKCGMQYLVLGGIAVAVGAHYC